MTLTKFESYDAYKCVKVEIIGREYLCVNKKLLLLELMQKTQVCSLVDVGL